MMCCVTKAMPIHFIDAKCHKATEKWKSCKTCLTNHTHSISYLITPLVINDLSGGHTHTHTHRMHEQK